MSINGLHSGLLHSDLDGGGDGDDDGDTFVSPATNS